MLPAVRSLRLLTLAAVLLPFAACSDGGSDRGTLGTPRGLFLAPDGRVIVADAGSGEDDGRVLAITLPGVVEDGPLEPANIEVLLDGLSSSDVDGRGYGDIAGPSSAVVAEDGVVCAAIGDGGEDRPGRLVCSDGLDIDLAAFERERNPDGGAIASDPFGVAADGLRGWFVSDIAANTVLFVDRDGSITVVAVFKDIEGVAADGMPAGLYVIQGSSGGPLVAAALYAGALAGFSPALSQPPIVQAIEGRAIAIYDDGEETLGLIHSKVDGDEASGSIYSLTFARTLIDGLDDPVGFTRIPGGRFLVAFADGSVEILSAD
jgi:hypothetical protein